MEHARLQTGVEQERADPDAALRIGPLCRDGCGRGGGRRRRCGARIGFGDARDLLGDSDARGPRFGGGDQGQRPPPGTRGGRPVWAQEGIPEVELGRLSVVRAPSHVIERALAEVLTNWSTSGSTVLTLTAPGQPTLTMTVAQLYSLPADQFANIVKTYYDSIARIDSPLENLALFQDIRVDGTTQLTGVTPASAIDLAAILLGSASDKTLPITTDTVLAVNIILQLPTLSAADLAALAAGAEAVRAAILEGHE